MLGTVVRHDGKTVADREPILGHAAPAVRTANGRDSGVADWASIEPWGTTVPMTRADAGELQPSGMIR